MYHNIKEIFKTICLKANQLIKILLEVINTYGFYLGNFAILEKGIKLLNLNCPKILIEYPLAFD